ncbi:thiolase domain-containing protein [Rhodococcoides kyotonense]|uniref:Acetyl-CoA C-acetyltransferase n=1 Tax=Rhodococcoides kyotonense TaxID=398843 RepID=A0A239L626_9NOCA|nr:thiolase domain-containing protein [Rhodococcus kyotonensis]SNT26066.1 acetyl-CoA C-acetyltransferase [Rhodococcus kyotonensis]
MTAPHIIGWAHTKFGKSESPDVEALIAEVSAAALADAGVDANDVDLVTVGVFNNGFSKQGFEGALVGAGQPGLALVPSIHVENACSTGSAALFTALDTLQAGRGRIALVVGAEKMTATPNDEINDILLAGCHRASESHMGSFAGVFADLADQYAARYGDPHDSMARIAAKNHRNGVDNPFAHMRRDYGFDFCASPSEKNPTVVGRLLRTDCSLVSDGAAALVVALPDVASTARRSVRIVGRAQANDHLAIARRADAMAFDGAARAFRAALADADVTLDDLDLLETHDCFTIAELLQYEAFGLADPGKGASVLAEGRTERDGILPVNRSGGLKAKGHPLGATGVSQHVMAALQLTGEAGDMQLPTADRAAVFNMGGAAVANYATVLEATR